VRRFEHHNLGLNLLYDWSSPELNRVTTLIATKLGENRVESGGGKLSRWNPEFYLQRTPQPRWKPRFSERSNTVANTDVRGRLTAFSYGLAPSWGRFGTPLAPSPTSLAGSSRVASPLTVAAGSLSVGFSPSRGRLSVESTVPSRLQGKAASHLLGLRRLTVW